MALAADVRAHLGARRHRVDVVSLDSLRFLERGDPLDEARAGDPERHRLRVVAVDAGDRVLDEVLGLHVGHGVDLLEAFDQVAVARLLVGEVDRRVAVKARARLLDLLSLGEELVFEHVGMAPLFAEISREGVAGPQRLEPRILLDLRLRDDGARVGVSRRARNGFASAEAGADLVDGLHVPVVLHREVLAPDLRILGLVVELDDAEEGVISLFLLLEDVDEQRRRADRDDRGDERRDDERLEDALGVRCFVLIGHGLTFVMWLNACGPRRGGNGGRKSVRRESPRGRSPERSPRGICGMPVR